MKGTKFLFFFFFDRISFTKIRTQTLKIHIWSPKRISKSCIIENFKMDKTYGIRFWKTFVKRNTILHVNALTRQEFGNQKVENLEKAEDKILRRVENDVLPQNRLRIETVQDLESSKILVRIKRSLWSNYSRVERPFKETRRKLNIGKGIICKRPKCTSIKLTKNLLKKCTC